MMIPLHIDVHPAHIKLDLDMHDVMHDPQKAYERDALLAVFRDNLAVHVPAKIRKIEAKYSDDTIYNALEINEKAIVIFNCLKMNASVIMQSIGLGIGVGGIIGGGVGAIGGTIACPCVGTTAGVVGGASVGAVIGGSIGAVYCAKQGYFHDKDVVNFYVRDLPTYSDFRNSMTEETYSVFSKFIDTYIDDLPKNSKSVAKQYKCPISGRIPLFPVFSPHDRNRLVPMEKEEIEDWLDRKEIQLNDLIASGASQEEIDDFKCSFDVNRAQYFTKDQLIYDLDHARYTIGIFRRIYDCYSQSQIMTAAIRGKNQWDIDKKALKAIDLLICTYHSVYQEAIVQSVDALRRDLVIDLGVSFIRANKICKKIENGDL
jgi:hypothetical protein